MAAQKTDVKDCQWLKMRSYELLIEDVLKKMMPSDENGSVPELKRKRAIQERTNTPST